MTMWLFDCGGLLYSSEWAPIGFGQFVIEVSNFGPVLSNFEVGFDLYRKIDFVIFISKKVQAKSLTV